MVTIVAMVTVILQNILQREKVSRGAGNRSFLVFSCFGRIMRITVTTVTTVT